MATVWSDFNNGETGLVVRNSLNTFNGGIASDMASAEGRLTANEGRLTATETETSTNTTNITDLDSRVLQTENDILALEGPQDTRLFNDLTGSHPAYQPGQRFYADGVMNSHGKYPDVTLQDGREMHLEVINNSGITITNGQVCRHDGVSGGIPQVQLCLADTFAGAEILGVATHDIPNGQTGLLTIYGHITMNTLGLLAGVPLYVSDTIPGGLTDVPPDIASQVGGALVIDASIGVLEVVIRSNVALPNILGLLQNPAGSGVYNLTSTPQVIDDYLFEGSVAMTVDKVSGTIITPVEGFYNGSFTASGTFSSSAQTRTLYVEIFESTVDGVIFTFPFNVPRDATTGGVNFNAKFIAAPGKTYSMRISSIPNMTITIDNVSMDIESVRI